MSDLFYAVVVVTLVGAAVTVGALFAFSTFIMRALKRLDDAEGIRAMQQINKTVYTPWFMGPFFGTSLLSIGAAVFALTNMDQEWWMLLLSAGLLYAIGMFGFTAVGNVPLNKRLAGMDADGVATAEYWRRYLALWTRWNHARVIFGVMSIILYSMVL
ncbi:MAG: DUF1772 domain-containing protein [Phycisphaerales bacterium]